MITSKETWERTFGHMRIQEQDFANFLQISDKLPAKEQRILQELWKAGANKKLLWELAKARKRAGQKTDSELRQRILVGARIPRETARRYRTAAAARGWSMYRFSIEAYEQMFHKMCDKSDTFGWD